MRHYLLQTKNTRHLLTQKLIIHIFLYSQLRIINPFCSSQLCFGLLRFPTLKKEKAVGEVVSLSRLLASPIVVAAVEQKKPDKICDNDAELLLCAAEIDPIFLSASRYFLPLLLTSLWPLQV